MKSNDGGKEMVESLLEYNVEKMPGEGFVARCVINPKISVFSKNDDEKLSGGIKSAAKLHAIIHPTENNELIRKNDFQMKRVD